MKFHRVYIELTNICGLKCSFCPPKTLPTHTMTLEFFESIVVQLKPYTKELAFHIVGDPLALSYCYWCSIQGIAEQYAAHPDMPLPDPNWVVDIVRRKDK